MRVRIDRPPPNEPIFLYLDVLPRIGDSIEVDNVDIGTVRSVSWAIEMPERDVPGHEPTARVVVYVR